MGLTLREALDLHNISVNDLSLITNVNIVSIYNFLNEKATPKEKTFQKLKNWEPDLEMKFIPSKITQLPRCSWTILKYHDSDEWKETDTLPGYLFNFKDTLGNISRTTGVSMDSMCDYLTGEGMLTKEEKDKLYDLGIDFFPRIVYDPTLGKFIPLLEKVQLTKEEIEISRLIARIKLNGGKIYGVENKYMGILCAKLHKMGFQYEKWIHPKYGSWCIKYWSSVKWKLQLKPIEEQEWVFKEEKLEEIIKELPPLVEGNHPTLKGQMALF